MKIIEKVACLVHYTDGGTDDGYIAFPLRVGGQLSVRFFTLTKDNGVELLINLAHVSRVEQSIIYKE